jgi:tetratricopeptide (TPR) repeat protein
VLKIGPYIFVLVLVTATGLIGSPARAEEDPPDPLAASRRAIERGDALLKLGRVVPACLQFEVALGIAPQWWYAAFRYALCRAQSGDAKDTLYLLHSASGSGRQLYVVHLALARWYAENTRPEDSIGEFEKAIALTKGAIEPMVELADLLVSLERQDEAERVLKKAQYFSPTNLAVRARLARVAEQLGHLWVAEEEYRFLAMRGANRRRNLALLARFYSAQGKRKASAGVLGILETGPDSPGASLPAPIFKPLGTQ